MTWKSKMGLIFTFILVPILVAISLRYDFHEKPRQVDLVGFSFYINHSRVDSSDLYVESRNTNFDEVTFVCSFPFKYSQNPPQTKTVYKPNPLRHRFSFPEVEGVNCEVCGRIYTTLEKYCIAKMITEIYPERPPLKIVDESYNDSKDIADAKARFKKLPTRPDHADIVPRLLGNRKVYLTLSTSPLRLDRLHHVLETIDLTYLDEILVVLPEFYGQKKEVYTSIPDSLLKFPKVKILRSNKDLGPATKLLPAVQYIRNSRGEAGMDDIFITVDDDTAYGPGMVIEMIIGAITNNAVVTGMGQFLQHWYIPGFGMEQTNKSNFLQFREQAQEVYYVSQCYDWRHRENQTCAIEVTEGVASVAFINRHIDLELMVFFTDDINPDFKSCHLYDDIVFCYVLAWSGVDRMLLRTPYYRHSHFYVYPYGFKRDALHRGNTNEVQDVNPQKMQKCYHQLMKYFLDNESLKLKPKDKVLPPGYTEELARTFKVYEVNKT